MKQRIINDDEKRKNKECMRSTRICIYICVCVCVCVCVCICRNDCNYVRMCEADVSINMLKEYDLYIHNQREELCAITINIHFDAITFNYRRRYVFAQIVISFIYFNEVFLYG